MYEEYFKKMKEEFLIRNRAENTFDCYVVTVQYPHSYQKIIKTKEEWCPYLCQELNLFECF